MRDESVTCPICERMYNRSQSLHNCPHLPITDEVTMPIEPQNQEPQAELPQPATSESPT